MPAPTPQQHHVAPTYASTQATHYHTHHSQSPAPLVHQQMPQAASYQPITPHVPFTPQPAAPMQSFQTPRPTPGYPQPYIQQPPAGYKAPQPVEVYVLNDHANASIPQDIRDQFQRDERGRVLFFTAPPLNVDPPLSKEGRALGHSARYLAAKAKKEAMRAAKRKGEEADIAEREHATKQAKLAEEKRFQQLVSDLREKTLHALEDQLAATTKADLDGLFGERKEGVEELLGNLAAQQSEAERKRSEMELDRLEKEAGKRIVVTGMTARLEEKI